MTTFGRRESAMTEHVVVYDQPPQFGRGIPERYDLRIFDVPENKRKGIMELLRHLGFMDITDTFAEKGILMDGELDLPVKGRCIYAQFFTGSDRHRYIDFWEKKESIEMEIDRINK
jgi:hypothetical protein